MKRERLMIYSRLINGTMSMQNYVIGPDGGWHDSEVTRLLTNAVNEALSEARSACISVAAKLPVSDEGACEICASAIDALKLPEE